MPSDEMVEKVARAISDEAVEAALKAWLTARNIYSLEPGDPSFEECRVAMRAALSAAHAEPVATEAAIRADERAAKALDMIAKMAGNVVFNGKQGPISHEDHMRAWADIEATAIRARGDR